MALGRAGIHPLREYRKPNETIPTPWSAGEWSVFVNDVEQLTSAIAYVQRHPQKEGLRPQHWEFLA